MKHEVAMTSALPGANHLVFAPCRKTCIT